jgi:hemerythrin-like metal-binding protein
VPTWNQNLSIGVPLLDSQHQELFRRTDQLLAAMSKGSSSEEVGKLFQFLDEYCSLHFSAEEKLMREKRYPGLPDHLAQHGVFVKEFEQVVAQFRAKGASPTVAIAVQKLVCGWLVNHIGTTDKKVAAFLAAGAQQRA